MTTDIEDLRKKCNAEEAACAQAQERIERGGLIGSFVGRLQKWAHTGELQQITDELDVAELYGRLGKEYPPTHCGTATDSAVPELAVVEPNYERFLPPSPCSLTENLERDPKYLRKCLANTLVDVAWAYDSLDHQTSSEMGGTEVQHDCYLVQELACKLAVEHR